MANEQEVLEKQFAEEMEALAKSEETPEVVVEETETKDEKVETTEQTDDDLLDIFEDDDEDEPSEEDNDKPILKTTSAKLSEYGITELDEDVIINKFKDYEDKINNSKTETNQFTDSELAILKALKSGKSAAEIKQYIDFNVDSLNDLETEDLVKQHLMLIQGETEEDAEIEIEDFGDLPAFTQREKIREYKKQLAEYYTTKQKEFGSAISNSNASTEDMQKQVVETYLQGTKDILQYANKIVKDGKFGGVKITERQVLDIVQNYGSNDFQPVVLNKEGTIDAKETVDYLLYKKMLPLLIKQAQSVTIKEKFEESTNPSLSSRPKGSGKITKLSAEEAFEQSLKTAFPTKTKF